MLGASAAEPNAAGVGPHAAGPALRADRGTLLTGSVLLAVAVAAWAVVVAQAVTMGSMDMSSPGGTGQVSPADAAVFTGAWGVMMAAMMLPSALPMILLYRTVSRTSTRALPTPLFAAVYLLVWLLAGLPVYAASVGVAALAATERGTWLPYALVVVLVAAGAYQFSAIKRMCLKNCQGPLSFVMQRWRASYGATFRLALAHAAYCVGCCWGLMAILVAAGAMSLPWVLLIAAVVFAEKLLPRGEWTARAVGTALVVLGLAVAVRPDLALALRGQPMGSMPAPAPAPGMGSMKM
jgi:predicted metal-binding membrane protein